MREAYIYDAVRTPRGKGKRDGALHEVKPVDLVARLLKALGERNDLAQHLIDDFLVGCVTQTGDQGGNIARAALLHAGYDYRIPALALNRFCASGLESINLGAMKIMAGVDDLVIAGGVESMSRVAMASDGGALFIDPIISEEYGFVPQGVSADLIATLEGYSRTLMDEVALDSHRKAAAARKAGHFKSIIPIKDLNGMLLLDRDETIREDASVETMGQLKPSFKLMGEMGYDDVALAKYPTIQSINHVHTAANSSGIVDGAGLALVGSAEAGRKLGLRPRAVLRAMVSVGSEPTIMLTGPIEASLQAVAKLGMKINDIDLFEVNEAFACVVLKTIHDTGMDPAKVNVNGGAIAMGHPIGATGAMLLGTILDELERRDQQFGLVTLCVGGGMGIATIIERV